MAVKAQTNNLADWITKANLQFITNGAAPGFVSHHKLLHCLCFESSGGPFNVQQWSRVCIFGYIIFFRLLLLIQFRTIKNYPFWVIWIFLLTLILCFLKNQRISRHSFFSFFLILFSYSDIRLHWQIQVHTLTHAHTHHWKCLEIQKHCLERLWESIIPLWSGS